MEHVLLSTKYLIAAIIPDVPVEAEEQMKREEFLVDKVSFVCLLGALRA